MSSGGLSCGSGHGYGHFSGGCRFNAGGQGFNGPSYGPRPYG